MKSDDTIIDAGHQALVEALNISFRLFRFIMFLLLLAYLASGVFIVQQHEKAFVLLFGKISGLGADRIKEPGIHWTWPRPFSEIVRISTERVQTLTSKSFWHRGPSEYQEEDVNQPGATLRPGIDGYTLTADANLLHSSWAVRYTVIDPETYLFKINDADRVIHRELDYAIVKTSAGFPIDRALRTDIESFRTKVEDVFKNRALALNLGIKVQGIDLLSIAPPQQIAPAFADVIQAEQERSQFISDARAYAARTHNEADGQAERIRVEGETYRQGLLSKIRADVNYFEQVYEKYKKSADVVTRTLLQDTLRRTLAQVEEKYVIHRSEEGEQEIRLKLSPESRFPTSAPDIMEGEH